MLFDSHLYPILWSFCSYHICSNVAFLYMAIYVIFLHIHEKGWQNILFLRYAIRRNLNRYEDIYWRSYLILTVKVIYFSTQKPPLLSNFHSVYQYFYPLLTEICLFFQQSLHCTSWVHHHVSYFKAKNYYMYVKSENQWCQVRTISRVTKNI